MIRRLFWMTVGAALALWLRRKIVTYLQRFLPKAVADEARSSLKDLQQTATKARNDAREAMKAREQELRDSVPS